MMFELTFPPLAKEPFGNHNIITLLQTNCPAEVKEANKIKYLVNVGITSAALITGRAQREQCSV